MCGIIGCTGVKNAAKILYRGLEDLEYRGYDSAGIAVLEGGSIHTVKRKGRVSALKCAAEELCGTSGIGHTRWATHGRPSDCNAHPHSSGRFSVVHNGIIENYAELRAELIAEGYAFFSQTDSEVVVHLLNKYYEGDLKAAVISAVQRLKGAFALCILCEQFEGFVAVKYRNPIIVGTGGGAAFAASDMPALSGLAESTLMLNRLENQQFVGEVKPYRLDLQIKECVILLEREWSAKDLVINSELAPVTFEGNETLMQQVWLNLLSNAVKFTPHGGEIALSLSRTQNEIVVKVADTGIGMSDEVASHIFDKYYQGDKSHATRGNGLGLAIVKRIITLTGGTVSVESKENAGSTFTVRLPA